MKTQKPISNESRFAAVVIMFFLVGLGLATVFGICSNFSGLGG